MSRDSLHSNVVTKTSTNVCVLPLGSSVKQHGLWESFNIGNAVAANQV
jgi:hypothetical protein